MILLLLALLMATIIFVVVCARQVVLQVCFLDRDGVLNVDIGYAAKISDLQLVTGVHEFLKELYRRSYQFIVITNQSGIARGYYGFPELIAFNQALFNLLPIPILDVFVCPHHIDGIVADYAIDCDCRKPKPGLFYQAFRKYPQIERTTSFMVGDSLRDCQAAASAGLASFLLSDKEGLMLPENCRQVLILNSVL